MDASNVIAGQDRHEWIGSASLGVLSLFAANAGLLLLYFVYGLSLFQLVVVLWVECFWIGLFSAIKLLTASLIGSPYENRHVQVTRGSGVLVSLVAIWFAAGGFLALFGATGIAIFFIRDAMSPEGMQAFVMGDIGVVLLASAFFFVGHGISCVVNFIILGEYRQARMGTLLALPYKRCIGLFCSIALCFGAVMLVPQFATTTLFAVLLLGLKVFWDYRLHLGERRALGSHRRPGSTAD